MKKKILIFFYLKYPLFIYSLYIFLRGAADAAKIFQKNTRICNLAFLQKVRIACKKKLTRAVDCVLKFERYILDF